MKTKTILCDECNEVIIKMNIDIKLLKKQIKALLESNLKNKTGLHNLLGEILDNAEKGKVIRLLGR